MYLDISAWKYLHGLFNVKDQSFEVFSFGMADVNRMVGGLRQLMENSDFAFALNSG
jgi:hypothetical protein